MGRSPLYKTKPRFPLPVATSPPGTPVYNPVTQSYETPKNPNPPELYEIHATRRNVREGTEQPGLEQNRMTLECRIVKSPVGKPLRLPDDFQAGSTFPLTFLGKPGEVRITPEPNAQHPTEAKKLG